MPNKKEKDWSNWPAAQSSEELREIALGICDGSVITSVQVPSELLSQVFMPVGLGAFSETPHEALKRVGVVFGYMKDAGGICVNNMPVLLACGVLNLEDWARVRQAVERERKHRTRVKV